MGDIPKKRCLLVILDGWGIGEACDGNAVMKACTPFMDEIIDRYPSTHLACCGEAVGLPDGVMGNSEVGHLNIGAGRIVYQVLLRIDKAIADGSFFENPALADAMDRVKDAGGALHLMGLVSDAGVHSQLSHLYALLEMAAKRGLPKVFVHVITDGRDTPPDSGAGYVQQLNSFLERNKTGAIASICGRYYAMDRDTRWDRTEKAFLLYTRGMGRRASDPVDAVKQAYQAGETDEFIKPVCMVGKNDEPVGVVKDGDGIIFFNFRPDRARQITRAFTEKGFDKFDVSFRPRLSAYVCMAQYDESFGLPVAFPPVHLVNILGEVISKHGLLQMRLAETEKYAHVTYFFNGGEETPFPGEDRKLIPSPREVGTYDKKPEMSAFAVAREAVSRLSSEKYDLVVVNFANLDMVGHTGVFEAAVAACEVVDKCLSEVVLCAMEHGYSVFVTADHGNAEKMKEPDGSPHTAHTLNPVPFIWVDQDAGNSKLEPGVLGDIAPTLLHVMGIPQPAEMTGNSLVQGG